RNPRGEPRTITLAVDVGTDLADLFDVKEQKASGRAVAAAVTERGLLLGPASTAESAERAGMVRGSPPPILDDSGWLCWTIDLGPWAEWQGCLQFTAIRGGEEVPPLHRCGDVEDETFVHGPPAVVDQSAART